MLLLRLYPKKIINREKCLYTKIFTVVLFTTQKNNEKTVVRENGMVRKP